MVQILLMLEVIFKKSSKVEDQFCGTPSRSEPSMFFSNYLLSLGLKPYSRVGKNPSETDSIKSQISSKTSSGKKDSIKRRHKRHHQRQPSDQLFPIQVATG